MTIATHCGKVFSNLLNILQENMKNITHKLLKIKYDWNWNICFFGTKLLVDISSI